MKVLNVDREYLNDQIKEQAETIQVKNDIIEKLRIVISTNRRYIKQLIIIGGFEFIIIVLLIVFMLQR